MIVRNLKYLSYELSCGTPMSITIITTDGLNCSSGGLESVVTNPLKFMCLMRTTRGKTRP